MTTNLWAQRGNGTQRAYRDRLGNGVKPRHPAIFSPSLQSKVTSELLFRCRDFFLWSRDLLFDFYNEEKSWVCLFSESPIESEHDCFCWYGNATVSAIGRERARLARPIKHQSWLCRAHKTMDWLFCGIAAMVELSRNVLCFMLQEFDMGSYMIFCFLVFWYGLVGAAGALRKREGVGE